MLSAPFLFTIVPRHSGRADDKHTPSAVQTVGVTAAAASSWRCNNIFSHSLNITHLFVLPCVFGLYFFFNYFYSFHR